MNRFCCVMVLFFCFMALGAVQVFEDLSIPGQFDQDDLSSNAGFYAADIDNNGRIDVLFGDYESFRLYEQIAPGSCEFELIQEEYFPTPCWISSFGLFDLNDNGLLDFMVNGYQTSYRYEQETPISYDFQQVGTYNVGICNSYSNPRMTTCYLDSTGVKKLFVGYYNTSPAPPNTTSYGRLSLFEYNQTIHLLQQDVIECHEFIKLATPAVTDYDNDGLIDLIVGTAGSLRHYEQSQQNSTFFNFISDNFDNVNYYVYYYPQFIDLNADGVDDLLLKVGDLYGQFSMLTMFRKLSADFSYEAINGMTFQFTSQCYGDVAEYQWDFDNDGTVDSTEENPIWHYDCPGQYQVKLTAINGLFFDETTEMVETFTAADPPLVTSATVWMHAAPNPVSFTSSRGAGTTICFSPSTENASAEDYTLTLINTRGQRVLHRRLSAAEAFAGSVWWDGRNDDDQKVATGLYFAILQQEQHTCASCKIVLMK